MMRKMAALAAVAVLLAGGLAAAQEPGGEAEEAAAAAEAPARRQARYAYFEVSGLLADSLPSLYLFETEDETLHALLRRLRRAAADGRLDGLVVRVGNVATGWAKVQEVRAALRDCREAGKEVVCVLGGGGSLGYYLATAGDRIVLAPSTHLMLTGLRAEVIFAGGLLEKIGVEADIVQAGKFKGAGETLAREKPTGAFSDSLNAVLDDYYEQLLEGIGEGRGISRDQAEELIERGPFTARQARAAGLVDDVLFRDQIVEELAKRREADVVVQRDYGRRRRPQTLPGGSMSFFSMLMGGAPARRPGTVGPAVAVIHAVGPILPGRRGELSIGEQVVRAESFAETVRQAADDENIKAIVVRVDSPGGSAEASDRIWRELRLADARKPVIASLSDVAASGGYYIAAGCRRIYAEPGCLTGSIGVFGGKLVLSGLFEKIGLNVAVFERGGRTGMFSMFSEFSRDERAKMEELILDTYGTFLARVAETRPGMGTDALDEVAEGRAWTGRQAHRHGLVDELGGLRQAVRAAREAAGLPADRRVQVLHLPRPRNLLEVLLFGEEEQARLGRPDIWGADALPEPLGRAEGYLRALAELQGEAALCLMPAVVTVR
jgi:protease-4